MDALRGKRTEWLLLFLVLPLVFLMFFGVWYLRSGQMHETVQTSSNSVWDLRKIDVERSVMTAAGDNAQFIPNKHILPQDFDKFDFVTDIPSYYSQYYTMRQYFLCEPGEIYGITMQSIDFAEAIYINGELYQTVGEPHTSKELTVNASARLFFTVIAPEDGVIEIVRQVSNFVHSTPNRTEHIRIGTIETATAYHNNVSLMNAVLIGMGFMIFVVHLTWYTLQREYTSNFHFAFLGLFWSLQVATSGEKMITALFPFIPWDVYFRIEFITIAMSVISVIYAIDDIFSGIINKNIKVAFTIIGYGIVFVYSFADPTIVINMPELVNIYFMLFGLYGIVVLLIRFAKSRWTDVEVIIIMLGIIVLALAFWRDTLYFNGIDIISSIRIPFTDFAMPVFMLFLVVANFFNTMMRVKNLEGERRELETQNATLDQLNALKGKLMANLTHELRTPLSVISSYAQLASESLKEDPTPKEQLQKDLELINNESMRLASMASDILQVYRNNNVVVSDAAYSFYDVAQHMSKLCMPMLSKNGNRMTVRVSPDLPHIYGNRDTCIQLLWNIISNANEHTQNDNILLTAHEQVRIDTIRNITVMVTDHGVGIPPEMLPHIFDREVTGRSSGVGIGLSLCKEIVQAHGGMITAESVQGEGTVFSFTMPIVGAGHAEVVGDISPPPK